MFSGIFRTRRGVCSPVLLGELDSDVVATEGEATILVLIGACGISGLEELDEGEALDGTEVWTGLVCVSRDVDVADGTILLEDAAELLNGDVAREVAGDDGLDARSERRDDRGGDGLVRELHASAVGADGENVRLALLRRDRGSANTRYIVADARDVTPLHRPIPQGFHNGVVVEPRLVEGRGEVLGGCGGRRGHLVRRRAWKGLEGLEGLGRLGRLERLSLCAGSTGYLDTAIF
jgi:hypothetical protein